MSRVVRFKRSSSPHVMDLPSTSSRRVIVDDSEDDDRERRRHKSSKHKKKSRRRSRSSSSEEDEAPRTVHINPVIANTLMDARMLHERITQQDLQLHHMGAEMASAHARINVLDNELRLSISARMEAQGRVNFLTQENSKLQKTLDEIRNVISTLESGISGLRKEKEAIEKAKVEAETREKVAMDDKKACTLAYQSAREQSEFTAKRNEVLSRKCEETLEKSKQLEEQLTTAKNESTQVKKNCESLETSVFELRKRIERSEKEKCQLETDRDAMMKRELGWMKEKCEMEKKILYKESQIRTEKRQHEDAMRQAKEKYDRLEMKKSEENGKSNGAVDETALLLTRSIEVLKKELTDQLNLLKGGMPVKPEVIVVEDASAPPAKNARKRSIDHR